MFLYFKRRSINNDIILNAYVAMCRWMRKTLRRVKNNL